MLIHGDPFGYKEFDALWVATEHMQWTVERIMLGLLHWPVERTEVNPAFLEKAARPMIEMTAIKAGLEIGRRKAMQGN